MFTREQQEVFKEENQPADGRKMALVFGAPVNEPYADGRFMALVSKGGPGSGVKGHVTDKESSARSRMNRADDIAEKHGDKADALRGGGNDNKAAMHEKAFDLHTDAATHYGKAAKNYAAGDESSGDDFMSKGDGAMRRATDYVGSNSLRVKEDIVQKGGPGSGERGHATYRDAMLESAHQTLLGFEQSQGRSMSDSGLKGIAHDYGLHAHELSEYHEAHKNDVVQKGGPGSGIKGHRSDESHMTVDDHQRMANLHETFAGKLEAQGGSQKSIDYNHDEARRHADIAAYKSKGDTAVQKRSLFGRVFPKKGDATVAQIGATGGLLQPEQRSHPSVLDADRSEVLPVHKGGPGSGVRGHTAGLRPGTLADVDPEEVKAAYLHAQSHGKDQTAGHGGWAENEIIDYAGREVAKGGGGGSGGGGAGNSGVAGGTAGGGAGVSGPGATSTDWGEKEPKALVKPKAKSGTPGTMGEPALLSPKAKFEQVFGHILVQKSWDDWNAAHQHIDYRSNGHDLAGAGEDAAKAGVGKSKLKDWAKNTKGLDDTQTGIVMDAHSATRDEMKSKADVQSSAQAA